MRKYTHEYQRAYGADGTRSTVLVPVEAESAEPLRVVVIVNAGIVEAVYCTDKAAHVDVIDHDNMTDESRAARDMLVELSDAQAIHMVY